MGYSGATHYSGTPCPCHCEGVRSTLKTLSYDCGNPGQYVCGRMPAVLFLFTGSPRFARDDNGSKCVFLGLSDHPVDLSPTKIAFSRGPIRRHPSAEGNFAPQRYVASSPLRRGGRSPGWSLYPHPPVVLCTTEQIACFILYIQHTPTKLVGIYLTSKF